MNLIDNVDFKTATRRCEANVVSEFSDLINAVIAGAVDFEYVEADALRNLSARIADSARVDGWAMNAVQGLGQDPGRRSFTSTARADKEVGVRNPSALNRVFQGLNDVILAQNVVEYLGPIFSREHLVTHADNLARIFQESQESCPPCAPNPRRLVSPCAPNAVATLVYIFCDRYVLLGRGD